MGYVFIIFFILSFFIVTFALIHLLAGGAALLKGDKTTGNILVFAGGLIALNPIPDMDSWRISLLRGSVHERKRKRKHQQITSRYPHHHRSSSHAWIGTCLINIKNSVRKIPYAIFYLPNHYNCPGRNQCTPNE